MNVGDIVYNDKVPTNSIINNDIIFNCPHCGNPIHALDIDYLEQTNHKIPCSYLEEISLDMKNALNNTEESVFIGYSLPNDDIDYMEMFITSINNLKRVKVVLYDNSYSSNNIFKTRDYYKDLTKYNIATVDRFCSVFSNVDEIKFNFSGDHNCFDCNYIY